MQKLLMCSVLAAICCNLQGCVLGELFSHPTPSWQQVPNYWDRFQFVPKGMPAKERVYNSCQLNIPKKDQCSGNGECLAWRSDVKVTAGGESMMFCRCYRDWADPECRTKRKSQMIAYLLSVFLGLFGGDHFYLGSYYSGFAKLATFGGAGVWWIVDIVRIGSAPIYANEYRLAYDLPHWFYVAFTVFVFSCLGYFLVGMLTKAYRFEKAKRRFLLKEEEAFRNKIRAQSDTFGPDTSVMDPSYKSYGVPLPHSNYGAVHQAVKQSGQGNHFSSWATYNHATSSYSAFANGGANKYDGWARPKYPQDFYAKASQALPEGVSLQQAYNEMDGY